MALEIYTILFAAIGFPNSRNDDLTRFIEKKLGKSTNALEEDKLD